MSLNRFFISEQSPAESGVPVYSSVDESQSLLHQRTVSGRTHISRSGSGVTVSIASSSANSFRLTFFYATDTDHLLSQSLLHQRTVSGRRAEAATMALYDVSIASSSANSFRRAETGIVPTLYLIHI